MKINRFYLSAVGAYLIWGFFPIALKELSAFPSSQILYFRVFVALILLLILSFVLRQKVTNQNHRFMRELPRAKQKEVIWRLALSGLLLATNWFSYIYTINNIGIQVASFAYLVCPIQTALLGFLLLGEKLKNNQWWSIGLSTLSCLLIGKDSVDNLLYVMIISSSYASFIIIQRVLQGFDKLTLLMYQLMVAFACIAPFFSYLNPNGVAPDSTFFYAMILSIAIIFTILPLFLQMYSLKELSSGTVGILMYANPLLNFGVAFIGYHEKSTALQIFAYLLIAVSVVLYNAKLFFKTANS